MNGYNPMIDYRRNELMAQQAMIQQQLAQLNQAQMMSQPQMQQPTAQPPQTRYYAKEVETFDEAKKTIPNIGEVYIFLDGKAGKIYLKQMNPDSGKSDYLFYNIDNSEKEETKDPIAIINDRLLNIEKAIGDLRNESVSGNAAVPELHERPGGNAHTEPIPADEATEPAKVPDGGKNVERKEPKRNA